MRRLDGISAFMVYNDVPRSYQHTLKIAILDWSESTHKYNYEEVEKNLAASLETLPMMKWKIARVPMGLNHPVWVEDLDFDFSYHIRRVACPAPGNKKRFNDLVSQLYAHSLDQTRPMWMAWVIEGLENDQVALVLLFHHAYADGNGASLMLQKLLQEGGPQLHNSSDFGVNPKRNPTRLELLVEGLISLPFLFVRGLPRVIVGAWKQWRLTKEYVASNKIMPPQPFEAPDSPLNTTFTHRRTFAYDSFELSKIQKMAKYFGITINDLLISLVTGAVRRHYQAHGYPIKEPLVTAIPINVRTEEQKDELLGNYVSNSFMSVPIQLEDPVERLKVVAASGRAMKDFLKISGSASFIGIVGLLPPITVDLINWILNRKKGQLKLMGNLIVSNVRGPREHMILGGARVANWLSIGQVSLSLGVNVTAWSYVDKFNICLMAEQQVIPDGEEFLGFLRDSYNEYSTLYQEGSGQDQP